MRTIHRLCLTALLPSISAFSAAPLQFQGAPTTPATTPGDNTKVIAIASGRFNHKKGAEIVTMQADGMLNGLFRPASHNSSAIAFKPDVVYIEAADVNHDGYDDVIAMDARNSAFLLFLNRGDGSFMNAVPVSVGRVGGPQLANGGLTVADVNGDDTPDVVTVARSATGASTVLLQQTFLGKGDGTFRPSPPVESTLTGSFLLTPGKSMAVTDMNRDGHPDLVLQLWEGSPRQAIVIAVSAGNGQGQFSTVSTSGPTVSAPPQPASNLAVTDVNGDGSPDAVFLTFSDQVFVSLGQPDGTLARATPVLLNLSGAVLLAIADLDRMGAPDLVIFGARRIRHIPR